jgi:hypothetical protein
MKVGNQSGWVANQPIRTEKITREIVVSFNFRMENTITTRDSVIEAGFSAAC